MKSTMTVLLPTNASHQPSSINAVGTAEYRVFGPYSWAVETTWSAADLGRDSETKNMQHGMWDECDARRFAESMAVGTRAQAVKVDPYYYCPAWGVVEAAEIIHYAEAV